MSIATGNLFADIPTEIGDEIFTDLMHADSFTIKRIVSKGQSSPESGWYDQNDNEWVVVLKGEAKILFESGDSVHLTSGSYLSIPAHAKHKVSWTPSGVETIWLAVYYH